VNKELSSSRKRLVKQLASSVAPRAAVAAYTARHSATPHSSSKPGVLCADISPFEAHTVLTGGVDNNAVVYNWQSGKNVETLRGHRGKVTDVRYHPTQQNLAFTTSADHTAIIWSHVSGHFTARHTLKDHTGEVVGCALHPSGAYMVTASTDKTWAFYDLTSGALKHRVVDEKLAAGFTRVTFHPDGLILGTGLSDSTVRIFDVRTQKSAAKFSGHAGPVSGVSFSENGYYLVSSDVQGSVKLWDLRKLENLHTIAPTAGDMTACHDVVFDASGTYVALATQTDVRMYAINGKQLDSVCTLAGHAADVTSVRIARDASYVLSTSMDRTVKVYMGATGGAPAPRAH